MTRRIFYFLVFVSSFGLSQAQKTIIDSPTLRDAKSKRKLKADSVVLASNKAVIAKIGNDNFNKWVDSILVRGNPAAEQENFDRSHGDSAAYAYFQKQAAAKPRYSYIYDLTYFFNIPGFGHYASYHHPVYLDDKYNIVVMEPVLPKCVSDEDKCSFIKRKKALSIVKERFGIQDTSLLIYKFHTIVYDINKEKYLIEDGKFVYNFNHVWAWSFATPDAGLILNANNGEIFNYTYYGQKTSDTLAAKKTNDNPPPPPEKKCDNTYAPVTGKDKRCYLNKCWAEKKGVKVLKEGYQKKNYKPSDEYTWPIEPWCNPLPLPFDTVPARYLHDGTLIYNYRGKIFRGTQNTCKCLPADARISTPKGEIEISLLAVGDTIWTRNEKEGRIAAPLILINKVKVTDRHQMLYIKLADGRQLKVSPGHPSTSQNISIAQFKTGDIMDGSIITEKYLFDYTAGYTYDILPLGTTGTYWANRILSGSTLFNSFVLANQQSKK